jgi:hypothetical protein
MLTKSQSKSGREWGVILTKFKKKTGLPCMEDRSGGFF